ncbi:MAG: VTT domain-containing protein [Mycobacteriales bacterium]
MPLSAPIVAVNLLSARSLVETFGTIGLLVIVFAETGLLLGFFLPGDSLLFLAGLAAAGGLPGVHLSLPLLLVTLPVAAIAGAQVGYLIGRRAGPVLFEREDSRLFRRSNVARAERVLERFGEGKAVVLARFVPIVRTFMNPLAGVVQMPARIFTLWNVVGGLMWTISVTLLGYRLGNVKFVANHLELLIVGIVALSLLPILVEVLRQRRTPERAG